VVGGGGEATDANDDDNDDNDDGSFGSRNDIRMNVMGNSFFISDYARYY